VDVAKCKRAATNFVVTGALDATLVVPVVAQGIRSLRASAVGARAITPVLANPYAARNVAVAVRQFTARLEETAAEAPAHGAVGATGTSVVLDEPFNWRDAIPFVGFRRAINRMNAACPS